MAQINSALREHVFARSNGICQCVGVCGAHTGLCVTAITLETFHASHLRAEHRGGIAHESNLEAWCSRCNLTLGARDARDTRTMPREWQFRELDKVVGAIMRSGAATLSGAPGAGKTLFAAFVFEALRNTGLVERLMVVVPRLGLAKQWSDALARARHIQLKPHSAIERPGQDGVVVTYQSLPNRDQLDAHIMATRARPTLLVLDEVHHLARDTDGTHLAWANAISELAGDVESGNLNVAGILNLSGTLWRSDRAERISTVRYTPPDSNNRIVSLVDGEVTVQELIQVGELRSVDLYRVDTHIRVADHAEVTFVEGNLADVDRELSRAAVRALADVDSWRTAFVASVLNRLERAHAHLKHHVKALIVAASQDQAERFCDEVDRQMRERGLQPLAVLAISRDEDEAQKALDNFRAQQRVGVLCTVDMAGEGYDCPDICVLGYASNKLTELYVRQVTARAMRVTDRERQMQALLPAVVVLPDAPELVEKFLSYLLPAIHEIRVEDVTRQRERPGEGAGPRLRRFVLDDAVPGRELVTVSFLDGSHENVDSQYMAVLAEHLVAANLPEVFWPRATAAMQRTVGDLLRQRPFGDEPQRQAPTKSAASLEQQAVMLQDDLYRLGRWWAANGDIPVSHFVRRVNEVGGIRDGERGSASVAQLERAIAFAKLYIEEYRRRRGVENN
jgi:superfamily II DNA or RNA helicase